MEDLTLEDTNTIQSALSKITEGDLAVTSPEELLKSFASILQRHYTLSEDVCNAIAYLAREEKFRSHVANDGTLIKYIVPLLSDSNDKVVIQALRATGNLCLDEDRCRQQFLDCGGCPLLRDVIDRCPASVSSPLKLQTVSCGCLLNVCCNNEVLCKEMHNLDIIKLLSEGMLSKCSDEMVLTMCLRALSVLIDADCYSVPELSSSAVPSSLSQVLRTSIDNDYEEVTEIVMEIIETHCSVKDKDADSWSVSVVKSGCYDVLLTFPSSLTAKVLDITVVILSSDEALELVFDNGKLRELVYSLIKGDSSVDVKLKASAALVLSNMARNDKNCEVLVKDGSLDVVNERLLNMPVSEENSKLHYAALSFIRNLSLPEANKLLMLENGVVTKIISILNQSNDPTVIMKSLVSLRLLSTKNDVCKLVCVDDRCITRICEVCENASFDHIKIEGGRLVSSLVKHSTDDVVKAKLAESDGVKWLLYLLKNEHMTVKNEGLVGLVLLATLGNDTFLKSVASFDEIPLMDTLTVVMETASREVLENCVTFLVLQKVKNDAIEFTLTDKLKELLLKSLEKKDISESLRTNIQRIMAN